MLALLNPCCLKLVNKCHHLNKFTQRHRFVQIESLMKRWKSEDRQIKQNEEEDEDDKPIRYTTSKAHTEWKARYNFRADDEEIKELKIVRIAVSGSFLALLVYFCILREENDIDEALNQPFFERFPHFERPLIEKAIHDHKAAGLETAELEKRLKELMEKEAINTNV